MDVFEAVADPLRRHILALLRDADAPAGSIAEEFPVSRPAVSRHLRVLREAGLVEARVEGQQRVYRVVPEPLAELEAWAAGFRPAGAGAATGMTAPVRGPAARLDALGTEVRRGRRARASEGSQDEQHDAVG